MFYFSGKRNLITQSSKQLFLTGMNSCPATNLVDNSGHELRIGLLIGQKLSNDLVHDILRWEEVVQKLRQDPGHHSSLAG